MSRAQSLAALAKSDPQLRVAGVERLGEIGSMADADSVIARLGDADPQVRDSAGESIWRIWCRSGDQKIDKLFAKGVEQMQAAQLADAVAIFGEIIQRKPAFAEGWNKRATAYFLQGDYEKSLRDCDEVFKRNPKHFGALSGAAQIHLKLGNLDTALVFFRRALEVNPNLEGINLVIPQIEQRLRDEGRTKI